MGHALSQVKATNAAITQRDDLRPGHQVHPDPRSGHYGAKQGRTRSDRRHPV